MGSQGFTKDIPSEEGFYWLRRPSFSDTVVRVIHFNEMWLVSFPGLGEARVLDTIRGFKWYGPITPLEE